MIPDDPGDKKNETQKGLPFLQKFSKPSNWVKFIAFSGNL